MDVLSDFQTQLPTNLYFKVSDGNCTVEAMSMHSALSAGVEVSPAFLRLDAQVAVRRPRPILQLYKLSNALSGITWTMYLSSIFALAVAMWSTYLVYKMWLPFFCGDKVKTLDFFIRPLAAITEPDPITWFKIHTTG